MALALLAAGSSAIAFADDFAMQGVWSSGRAATSRTTFTSLRDPQAFMQDLTAPVMPKPVVLLTLEDAVAHEILRRTRTLRKAVAMKTAQVLYQEARTAGYDPLLFLAVIHIESLYDHLAISPVGAEGLMQLMPRTARWVAARHRMSWRDQHSFDPILNVRLGIRYLIQLHRQFRGDMEAALTAYNRGPHNTRAIFRRYGRLPRAVREFYSQKVLDRYQELRARYGHLPAA